MNDNYTVTINGVEFNSFGPFRLQPPVRGFGSADVRSTEFLNSGAHGGQLTDQFYGFRQIPLEATLKTITKEEHEERQLALNQALPIGQDVEVNLRTPTGKQYVIFARRVNDLDPRYMGNNETRYGIELRAGDINIYDYTEGSAMEITLAKEEPGGLLWLDDDGSEEQGGLLWADDDGSGELGGLLWADGTGGAMANNLGTAPVYPQIIIEGAAINPIITNQRINQSLELNLTTTTSDIVVIDNYRRTATLNGINIFNNLVQEDFFRLEPGLNEITYNSLGSEDSATAKVRWRNAHFGVM